jgi:hypothetical protein
LKDEKENSKIAWLKKKLGNLIAKKHYDGVFYVHDTKESCILSFVKFYNSSTNA